MADLTPSEQLQELLAGYVIGDLTPDEAETLRRLLAEQPDLASELQALQEVLAAMPYALPEVKPPAQIRANLLDAARTPATSGRRQGQRRQQRSPTWLVGSVAAMAALAFGLDGWRLRQQLSVTQAQVVAQTDLIAMLQQPTTKLVTLKGMDTMATASGNVVLTPGEQGAIVILQNLPALQRGQYYYLWAETDGKKVACGKFTVSKNGAVMIKLAAPEPVLRASAIDRSIAQKLVVTVENSDTMTTPTGPMVMVSTS